MISVLTFLSLKIKEIRIDIITSGASFQLFLVGPNFFSFFNATGLLKNCKKPNFICSNSTFDTIHSSLLSFFSFFSFLSLFLFSFFFSFFLSPLGGRGGDGPLSPPQPPSALSPPHPFQIWLAFSVFRILLLELSHKNLGSATLRLFSRICIGFRFATELVSKLPRLLSECSSLSSHPIFHLSSQDMCRREHSALLLLYITPPPISYSSEFWLCAEILLRFHSDSTPVPLRFYSGSTPVFHSGSAPVPLRLRFHSGSAPVPLRFCSGSAPVPLRFHSGSAPVPLRFCSGFAPDPLRFRSGRALYIREDYFAQLYFPKLRSVDVSDYNGVVCGCRWKPGCRVGWMAVLDSRCG